MSDASQKRSTPPVGAPSKRPPAAAKPPPGGSPANLPPPPSVQQSAPGVRSATQVPEEPTTLRTGDTVAGAFTVQRYLGSSAGAISYLCSDKKDDTSVVVKVLTRPFPGDEIYEEYRAEIKRANSIRHKNLTRILGMGKTGKKEMFVAMEYVSGSTLSRLVAQRREAGDPLELRDVFTILAHACDALEAVHTKMGHGVLTPYNISLSKNGVVKVGNLVFDRIAGEYMASELGAGPFVDSIYIAPEVSADPKNLSPAADLFSLGMLAAELLSESGLPDERKRARHLALDGMNKYPPSLVNLIASCIDSNPENRPRSVREFRDTFEDAAREAGVKLGGAPPPGCLPLEPAVDEDSEGELGAEDSDLFNIELPGFGGADQDDEDERYLLQKDGLDYGPFTREQVLEQLYADEIDEFNPVLDRFTQERIDLGEMGEFKEAVAEYIPKREERRRLEAEARAELERKVKKGASIGLVVAVAVGAVVLIIMTVIYIRQPKPIALPLDTAFASLDFKFLPPPKDFETIAVDKNLMASIFNLNTSEEEIQRRVKRQAKAAPRQAAKGRGSAAKVAEVDLSEGGGNEHFLSDSEINQIIMSQFGQLRNCVMLELKNDRSFRGVTVQFFIRPSGTTGGVTIQEASYANKPVGDCLKQRFRSMSFPEHGAISNKGVTFPLTIQ